MHAFIAAMPGWKQDVGRTVDALISQTAPEVQKAVKWNTPFYAVGEERWFAGFHCITKYVKVAFFQGTLLLPMPPVASKQASVRYLHIQENQTIDEVQFVEWIRQASALPGEKL